MISKLISQYGLQMICLGPIFVIVVLAFVVAGLEQIVGKEIGCWFRKEDGHEKAF